MGKAVRENAIFVNFLSYGKAISALLVVFIHFNTAFFNSNQAWSSVVCAPSFPDTAFPWLIRKITLFDGQWGFLVVFSVCFFFLSTGFTLIKSLESKTFLTFWKKKLYRLLPFYTVVLLFDMMIAFLSSMIYKIPFPHTPLTIIEQLLMGLQYLLPNTQVIDLVIWFLGVELIFYFITSVIFYSLKRFTNLKPETFISVVDIIVLLLILIVKSNKMFFYSYFTKDNVNYLIKSFCLILFMLVATIFSYHFCNQITDKKLFIYVVLQFVLFCIIYKINILYINYVDVNSFVSWFGLYIVVFWLMYIYNSKMPEIRLLKFIDGFSYSIYICHGYIGYFIVSSLIHSGVSKSIAITVAMPIAIFIAYLLNKYVEKPIYLSLKKQQ